MMDSALVHEADAPDAPRTHAIVIGMGTYDHLTGGEGPLFSGRLGQLESPVPSAKALADWFLTEFHHPGKPLGSLSVVLSDGSSPQYEHPVTREVRSVPSGTGAEVVLAIREWAKRAGARPDNLGIFYFCGHGLFVGKTSSLILRDFGGDDLDHDGGLLDADAIVDAMKVIGPLEQVYMFDACRCRDGKLAETTGRRALTARPSGPRGLPKQSVMYSAMGDTKAYGQPGKPSVFMEHLLVGLSSAAQLDGSDRWWVDSSLLGKQIQQRSSSIQVGEWKGQEISFHQLRADPRIPVRVTCHPSHEIHRSVLTCLQLQGEHVCGYDGTYALPGDAWETFLPPDRYRFTVAPNAHHAFESSEFQKFILPPFACVELPLTFKLGNSDVL